MTEITRKFLETVQADINEALKAVGEKHNVRISTEGGSFRADNATFKLSLSTFGDAGELLTPELSDLRLFHSSLEGKIISIDGKDYTVVGFKRRATKNKFVVKSTTGKIFVAPASLVNH